MTVRNAITEKLAPLYITKEAESLEDGQDMAEALRGLGLASQVKTYNALSKKRKGEVMPVHAPEANRTSRKRKSSAAEDTSKSQTGARSDICASKSNERPHKQKQTSRSSTRASSKASTVAAGTKV